MDKLFVYWEKGKAAVARFLLNCKPYWEKFLYICSQVGKGFQKAASGVSFVGVWTYKLRSLFLAIPVAAAALVLAAYNMNNLPEEVGFSLLTSGEYAYTISRGTAVCIPLLITGLCLLLMFCSRRVVYPWLISIFSLVLPVLIMVTTLLAG